MNIRIAEPAQAKKLIENDRVIVTSWKFNRLGDHTQWHRHHYDYLVVPLFNGKLEIDVDGVRNLVDLNYGVPYFKKAGIEHDVINANDFSCEFIEIELKEQGTSYD